MKKSKCTALRCRREWEVPTFDEVSATYLIRQMKGKSQSVLALCEDGFCYVLKFAGNPKGRNSLANELLGYQFAEALDIRVPKVYLATVDPHLIRYAPRDWFDNYFLGLRPSPDVVHFGTRFIGYPPDSSTTEWLPRVRFPQIRNRDDFMGMLVFDIWANTQRPRQAVFERAEFLGRYASFIDFGSAFGGPDCIFCDNHFDGFYFDTEVYGNLENDDRIDAWISRLRRDAPKILAMSYEHIPADWYNSQYVKVRGILFERLNRLEDLVYVLRWNPGC
jgi:hypothetical protein